MCHCSHSYYDEVKSFAGGGAAGVAAYSNSQIRCNLNWLTRLVWYQHYHQN